MTHEFVVTENEPFSGLTATDIVYLRRRIGGRLVIDERKLRVTRLVGHVPLPSGIRLRIRSGKSSQAALLAWMAYVDPSLRALELDVQVERAVGHGDLEELLVRLFLRQLQAVLRRSGMLRGYRQSHERGSFVRGRIDFQRLIRDGHNLARTSTIVWTRVSDTPLNRVISAALVHIQRDASLRAVAPDQHAELRALFADVAPVADAALLTGRTPLARTEEAYRSVLALARVLLGRGGLGDGTEFGGFAFLIDLERLFESAVQRAFDEADLTMCKPQAKLHYVRRRGRTAKRVPMFIDVLCERDDLRLVVDAKFKSRVSAANVQQMVTYAVMTGASGGALVLPGSPEDDGSIDVPLPRGALKLRLVHLDTGAVDLAGWRRAGADLVARALRPL